MRRRRGQPAATPTPAFDEVDEVPDRHFRLEGVAEPLLAADDVVVSAAYAHADDQTRPLEVTDDLLHGTLGDPDAQCDVTQEHLGVHRQTHEHVPVVGEERPSVALHVNDDKGNGVRGSGIMTEASPPRKSERAGRSTAQTSMRRFASLSCP
jgi:hypothetical protein